MLAGIRSRFTFANTMAAVAVFFALGGGSYATVQLASDETRAGAANVTDNSVRSGDIVNDNVRHADIGPNAVQLKQIAPNSITSIDIVDGSIGPQDLAPTLSAPQEATPGSGTQGAQGPAGPAGPTGPRGPSNAFSIASENDRFLGEGDETILELDLPDGMYVVMGNVHGQFSAVSCYLELDGDELPGAGGDSEGSSGLDHVQAAIPTGGTVVLECSDDFGEGEVDSSSLIAIQVAELSATVEEEEEAE
ncbi:MAG: hypothetical protein WD844_11320 [Thermoleophilaceae bacterium]